jgi:hypothetical protein
LELFEIDRLVEFPLRGGREVVVTEAECARAVVGRLQQVIQFTELGIACVLLDDTTAPVVGPGIARRAEDAVQSRFLVGPGRELEFDGIELNGVLVLQIGAAVDKPPEGIASGVLKAP